MPGAVRFRPGDSLDLYSGPFQADAILGQDGALDDSSSPSPKEGAP